ncbi:lipopolysaccharide biosynthesis protein [Latilactobacillus sp. 5-91]|uniref:lipopolysaccharide biosynthesis protein n=1 Tax=Latilactobacillus sp. 5-91 TaxID=3410924 RepID=UPI003C79628E
MMNKSRSKAALVNSSVATIAQVVLILAQFVSRTIFIKTLGSEYLGLNGLFVNLLSMLNLAELGIGNAITFSLFKPLADNNKAQVSAIMRLLKKWYRMIAIIVLLGGVVLMPFIPNLIHKPVFSDMQLWLFFFLALMGTISTYLLSYKRTLLIANQEGYINTINTVGFSVGQQIIQIVFLIVYPNFYIYLIIQLLANLFSNINISRLVDKKYPYLKDFNISVDKDVLKYFKKNVTGMISAKLGGVVVNGTDNLVISFFLGLATVGKYANYTLITTGLTAILTQAVSAVSASVGNLAVSKNDSKEKEVRVFNQYFSITIIVSLIMAVGIAAFSTAFVTLWIGEGYVLSRLTVFLISLNFFIQAVRQSVITYANSYGLYWQQRYKPIFESVLNLLVSIILIKYTGLGLSAVLIGTIASNILVNLWWEPYVVFKYGFQQKVTRFLFQYYVLIITGGLVLEGVLFIGYQISNILFAVLFTSVAIIISIGVIVSVIWILGIKIQIPKRIYKGGASR